MSSSYRRVAQRGDGSGTISGSASNDSLEANVTQSRSERLQDKLVARKLFRCGCCCGGGFCSVLFCSVVLDIILVANALCLFFAILL
jgi:hypothetical protein